MVESADDQATLCGPKEQAEHEIVCFRDGGEPGVREELNVGKSKEW
jgi:hypothetical protein